MDTVHIPPTIFPRNLQQLLYVLLPHLFHAQQCTTGHYLLRNGNVGRYRRHGLEQWIAQCILLGLVGGGHLANEWATTPKQSREGNFKEHFVAAALFLLLLLPLLLYIHSTHTTSKAPSLLLQVRWKQK
jgi:hypothetical protein